jgi:hypothetical protein
MLSTETHHYDGIIGKIYHSLPKDETDLLSFEDSLAMIGQWVNMSLLPDKSPILRTLDLFRHDQRGNYDHANQIDVRELLPRVMRIVKDFDSSGIDLFLVNLGEISQLGSCPQGRTTRLLSFYIPYVTL